ncbi:uncharacterized protein LOC110935597 isoform X7 [Helianthus annuus]|uniref:uncharacterized protein LOC110935597 isoform X7 n=1 Tax=Helianthus annuus TaxID=4232 RepID=UPI001652E492|nr:uncharacterized protein LOC110935597 isoform X7 [Helianthus annuus]
MLAVFRVEAALNFTIAYRISKSVPYFQWQKGYSCASNKMVGGNNNTRPKWRGVSVQACSAEDVDVNVEVKSQVQVHDGRLAESSSSKMASSSTDKHSISLEVGSSLFRFIKGKWGSTQAKIEEETGARLIFPPSRNDESLIIEGTSESVAKASERIQLLIDEVVKSPALDYSHFVSLPLALHPQFIDKLIGFQNSILGINDANSSEVLGGSSNNDGTNEDATKIPLVSYPPKSTSTSTSKPRTSTLSELGIDKSIFIKPQTFHLTVLMLKLWNKERVNAAAKIFKECMKGSFAKARVLYAPVEVVGGEDRLLGACKIITDAFIKGGLVLEKDAKNTLKLHATVMNVRQRKRKKDDRRKFDWFDARGIMEQYGSEEWGEYVLPELHLSQSSLVSLGDESDQRLNSEIGSSVKRLRRSLNDE